MAITSRGQGTATFGTTSAAPDWVAGAVGDAIVALVGNKPYSSTPTAPDGTWTNLSSITSGSVANAVSSGSTRATAFLKTATATGTGTATFSTTSGSPTMGKTARFGFSTGSYSAIGFSLADTDETLAAVSASTTIGAGDVINGDYIVVIVALKDDAITHATPTFNIAGATHPAMTWTASTTTTGNDGGIIVAITQMNGGSSTGSVTYSATSSVAGASAAAITVVRLRELTPTPTLTAISTSQINVSWSSVTGATSYTLERSANGTSGWSTIYTGATASFSDTGLSASTTYYYRVTADNIGNASAVAGGSTFYALPFTDDFSSGTWGKWSATAGTTSVSGGVGQFGPAYSQAVALAAGTGRSLSATLRARPMVGADLYVGLGDGTWSSGFIGNGYMLVFTTGGGISVQVVTAGSLNPAPFTSTTGWVDNTWYQIRLDALAGGTVGAKVWTDGTAEPSAYGFNGDGTLSAVENTFSPTRLQLINSAGATLSVDDVSLFVPTGDSANPPPLRLVTQQARIRSNLY